MSVKTTRSSPALARLVNLRSATALVVANIIGAGVFTTTGFQAAALGHPGFIFMLWLVGGLLAWCGAMCYAELGAMMPEAGAEYVYLRETFGKAIGFMSAFVSLVAGFSAAIAAALEALISYLTAFYPVLNQPAQWFGFIGFNDILAISLVWVLIALHSRSIRLGFGFNDLITLFKVVGIVVLIVAAFSSPQGDWGNFVIVGDVYRELSTVERFSAFSVSLIFVMFCYTGWNAAAYIAGEMEHPQRNLPIALLSGTAIVTLLYLGLNAVFFYGADVHEMSGVVEVGLVSARQLFGQVGVSLTLVLLVVSLFASASAMTIAGPRVYYALGRDHHLLSFLSKTRAGSSIPVNALVLQGMVITIIILSARIDQILQYAGFTLALFSSLAVASVIVLRIRLPDAPRPFRVFAYPYTPILFLTISGWVMVWNLFGEYWLESLLALATVVCGGLLFYIGEWHRAQPSNN
ncbi:MAG: amino acid permease [Pseudohongiellaceae bacterium]